MNEYKKAIETIKYIKTSVGVFGRENDIDLAIKSLEKQIPKKVTFKTSDCEIFCPTCKEYIRDNEFYDEAENYCSACGQKLEW